MNIFRLLLLTSRLPPLELPSLPMGRQLKRANGASLTFMARSVLKRVEAFGAQPNVNPEFGDLVQVPDTYDFRAWGCV